MNYEKAVLLYLSLAHFVSPRDKYTRKQKITTNGNRNQEKFRIT